MGLLLSAAATQTTAQTLDYNEDEVVVLDTIVILSAEEQLKQALGVSTITSEDLERLPPARDLSEIIRKQPGVNLTGNTSSGQYGQSRQIDLRGMGPENTLILIDGKPVLSRNAARMGRQGERDTRGDSNWVPPELIEVIRGPAAARYGSGAAGGGVNIITKRPDTPSYSVSTFMEVPENSDEGGTRRVTGTAGGPINDVFSYRVTVSGTWTDPDATDINAESAEEEDGVPGVAERAGREGVVSYNLRGLLSAEIDASNRFDFEAAWSRQSNSFVGATQSGSIEDVDDVLEELMSSNAETSRIDRTSLSLTHVGEYAFASSNSYIQWENTTNRRPYEGLTRGGESVFTSTDGFRTTTLNNLSAKSEWVLPVHVWREQKLTLGSEYRGEFLDAPIDRDESDTGAANLNTMTSHLLGLYAEDNILVMDQLTLTPGLRLDYHDKFGANFSPSFNASYDVTDRITVKAGIARAFKAPNLYQLSPEWYWNSRGNGCPAWNSGSCVMRGNADLDPEISINKEIGIAYNNMNGWEASLSYFHNNYQNKIMAGEVIQGQTSSGQNIFDWVNSGPAVISGLEGNVTVPLHERVTWTTNFTKMLQSEREVTAVLEDGSISTINSPLSLVPEYTINTALRWEPRETLGFTLSATHYGEVKPTNVTVRGLEILEENRISREAYTIANIAFDYEVNESVSLSAGINNLFNKRLFATGGSSSSALARDGDDPSKNTSNANTYNEPGRSFWVSLTGKF